MMEEVAIGLGWIIVARAGCVFDYAGEPLNEMAQASHLRLIATAVLGEPAADREAR